VLTPQKSLLIQKQEADDENTGGSNRKLLDLQNELLLGKQLEIVQQKG
jgi:hypothetical protein